MWIFFSKKRYFLAYVRRWKYWNKTKKEDIFSHISGDKIFLKKNIVHIFEDLGGIKKQILICFFSENDIWPEMQCGRPNFMTPSKQLGGGEGGLIDHRNNYMQTGGGEQIFKIYSPQNLLFSEDGGSSIFEKR